MHLEPEWVATGVTRVREWRSGVQGEAQEIEETEGTQEACRRRIAGRVKQNLALSHRPQGAPNSGINDHRS